MVTRGLQRSLLAHPLGPCIAVGAHGIQKSHMGPLFRGPISLLSGAATCSMGLHWLLIWGPAGSRGPMVVSKVIVLALGYGPPHALEAHWFLIWGSS